MTTVLEMPVQAEPRFRLYTEPELAALPPVEWLLDRHLPEHSVGVVYGQPGTGKSFLALAWARSIATLTTTPQGLPWFTYPTRWGPVVYLAAEGSAGLGQRLRAYTAANEITAGSELRFLLEPVNLLTTRDVTDLLHAITTTTPEWSPALIVCDTMARVMPGADENAAKDVGAVIGAADLLRRETGASVLFVHHTQKAGELERGSSALRGAADAMFSMKLEDDVVVLECTKQKDAPAIGPQRFRLVPGGGSCTLEPVDAREPAKGMTRNTWKALRALMDHFPGGEATIGVWIGVTGLPPSSFYMCSKRLQELGYVTKRGARYVVSEAGSLVLQGTPMVLQ